MQLKSFMKDLGLKQKDLQAVLNVSQPYISLLMTGKLPVPDETIATLRNHYGDVVDKYILDGDVVEVDNNYVKLLPLLPLSAQGGSLNDFVVSVRDMDCEKIISPISDADYAISISGDSMAPEYPNGCQILIKRINERAFIEWGRDYVLDTCNGVVIKRLAPSEKEGFVRCVSLNPNPIYAPFDVSLQDVYGIYNVKLCLSSK